MILNYIRLILLVVITIIPQPALTQTSNISVNISNPQLSSQLNASKLRERNFYTKRINQGTVSIISGGMGDTYNHISSDLSATLDDEGQTLRILSVNGKGGLQNISDLLYLKGIDLAIVQSDILDAIERQKLHYEVRKRVTYITKLYNSEFHIVTRRDIKDVRFLGGRLVNMGFKGSASDITSTIIFDNLEIPIKKVYMDHRLALEKVKSGEIAGTLLMTGKPAEVFANVKPEDGLHMLPVRYKRASDGVMMNNKYTRSLVDIYLPSVFTHEDYPGLIPIGTTVPTLAGATVLAAYNWPVKSERYKKVKRFIERFFQNFPKFRKSPNHPKWKEVNLSAKLPGWKRFHAAGRLLGQSQVKPTRKGHLRLESAFNQLLKKRKLDGSKLSPQQKQELFELFKQWHSNSSR